MHADMNQVKTDDEGDDSAYEDSVDLVVNGGDKVEDKMIDVKVDKVENDNEVPPDYEQEQEDEVPDWMKEDGGDGGNDEVPDWMKEDG